MLDSDGDHRMRARSARENFRCMELRDRLIHREGNADFSSRLDGRDPLIDADTSRLLASALPLRARMLMRARYTRRYIGEIWTRVKRALIDSRLARSTARPAIPSSPSLYRLVASSLSLSLRAFLYLSRLS